MYRYYPADVWIRPSRCIDTTQHASLHNVADASTIDPRVGHLANLGQGHLEQQQQQPSM